MIFDPMYFLAIAPAVLLALWAQMRVKSAYAEASKMRARMPGAEAARSILDAAGLRDVRIEQVGGQLTDHYDPRDKVLRLSTDVYVTPSLAAVGIAAHEAGHALQDAQHYAPLSIRNAAVPIAGIGSNAGLMLAMLGMVMRLPPLMYVGMALFAGVVFFQLINLPVEFDASNRAKALLVDQGIISREELPYVRNVLNAAAWTYVAGTLQAVMILLYLLLRARGSDR